MFYLWMLEAKKTNGLGHILSFKSKHMDSRQIKRHTILKAMHNQYIFMETK